jgi:Ion transport protein
LPTLGRGPHPCGPTALTIRSRSRRRLDCVRNPGEVSVVQVEPGHGARSVSRHAGKDDPNLDTVIYTLNGLFSLIFLGDFTYRLFTSDSKSPYFLRKFDWADLLASLPFPQAKVLRIFRLMRVFRLLRGMASRASPAAWLRIELAALSPLCC